MSNTVTIPAGAKCLTVPKTGEKLCHCTSWVWSRMKSDESFPKPVRIGGRTLLLEHEIDAWLAEQIAKARAA